MVSRKGAILVAGGSLLITLGSLVFAALWVTPLLTSSGRSVQVWSSGAAFPINQSPLAQWIMRHAYTLSVLAGVTGPLGTGGAFFLGLALLQPGLTGLVRGQASASAKLYRWLAILGLLSTLLAVLGQVTLALVYQAVGFPRPVGVLLLLVKMPLLWLGLLGFGAVLWGSSLRSQPGGSSQLRERP